MMDRLAWIDRLSGKSIRPYLQLYRETQWYDRDRMAQWRGEKLSRVLRFALDTVPFYRDLGLEMPAGDPFETLRRLPVIDKALVRGQFERFLPVDHPRRGGVRMLQTGGTTGAPLRVPLSRERRSSAWAAMYRYYEWMGISLADRKALLWGAPVVRERATSPGRDLRTRVLDRLENKFRIDSFRIRTGNVSELAALFERERPRLLRGYCQSIYELARLFESAGFRFPLAAISSTVEPLFPSYREIFRRVFGCEAFDQYGCGEVESVAFECSAHRGLHVAEERCVLEVDADGSVVLTDLDNLAFPLLRYRPGDLAELAPDEPCPCGRSGPRILRILGRSGDVIVTPDGGRLHPEFFTHLLNETGISYSRGLTRYQVVQTDPDRLVWKVASSGLTAEDRKILSRYLRDYAPGVQCEFEEVEAIPESSSGKFRYVISNVERGGR